MKKYIFTALILCFVTAASAQKIPVGTNAQQQMLKNATPAQLEAIRKATQEQEVPATGRKGSTQTKDILSGERSVNTTQNDGRELDEIKVNTIELNKIDPLVESLAGRQVAILPVYGREIFRQKNLTFAPSMSMATPLSYVLASGDELNIVLWGAAEGSYSLKMSPEGNINIPNVGLVNLSGLTVGAAEKRIKDKLTSAVAGLADGSVNVKVTLGNIRSIKINIVGEAENPGTYTLPSLSTLFNALYAAGGVSDIGSLRNIKLYRAGKEMAALDVYEYLLKGKTDIDMRLEDNDMIVVLPYDNIVSIVGKVKRPRAYEMKRGEDLATLIAFAGDFKGDAYNANLSLIRRSGGQQYAIHTIDKKGFEGYQIFDRDVISVGEITPSYSNRVEIDGAVWRPGAFELSDTMKTVKQLVQMAEGLRTDAFVGRAQLMRLREDMTLEIIPLNLGRIMTGEDADVELENNDRLAVAAIGDLRENRFVTIKGEVNNPTTMPFMEKMKIEDLVVFARGLRESASLARVEVSRRVKNASSTASTSQKAQVFTFTIPANLSIEGDLKNFTLEPFDEVYIRRSPGYSVQKNVFVEGQVLFPGEYTITTTATRLTDMVEQVGGFTPEAYVKGASLYRRLTADDMLRIESIKKMENSMSDQDLLIKTQNLGLGDYYQVGINLVDALEKPKGQANISIEEGDRLVVPLYTGMVKIGGAVYYPTSTTYQPSMTVGQYIESAGGYSNKAKRRPFVIYQNGTISTSRGLKIEPGCEIVVPERPAREPMSVQAWIGISSSVVAMCAMLVSILR